MRLSLAVLGLVLLPLGPGAFPADAEDGSGPIRRTTAEIMRQAAARERLPRTRDYEIKKKPVDRSRWHPNPASPLVSRQGGPEDVSGERPPRLPEVGPNLPQAVSTPNFTSVTFADDLALPPDTMGAVGPTNFLTHVNGRVRVHSKTTGAVGALDVDADTFWAPVREDPVNGFVSDPRVRFDRLTERWFLSILDIPGDVGTNGSRILLAMSNGPNITAGTVWSYFYFDQDLAAPPGDTGCLADYPTLGIDASALYLAATQFCGPNLNNLTFFNSSAWVVRKSDLLAGSTPANLTLTAGAVKAFRALMNPATFEGLYVAQGADNYDPTATKGYFIGVDGAEFGTLVLREVANPGSGSPTLGPDRRITVPATSFPIAVTSPGGGLPLDGIDHRLMAAHLRNGRLWTSHQVGVNSTGVATPSADRNAVRWYEIGDIATATPTVAQAGTVYDGSASKPLSYWMGTIVASGQGHAALGFTAASSLVRPAAATVGRLAGDAAGTTQGTPVVYQAGLDDYDDIFSPPPAARWGDYSMTSLDPCDDMTMWTTQEYAEIQLFPFVIPMSWGARVVRLLAPPPAIPASANPPTIPAGQASVAVTVNGTTSGGRGFYDTPSTGMPSCRQRISATLSNGITVNSVTLLDADTVGLDLNTTAATLGPASVTITNPDGQSATASILTVSPAGGASLSGTKTVSGAFVPAGAVSYTVILTNGGGSPQTDNSGDEFADVLPAALALTTASATSGTAVANGGTNTATWNGSLPPSGSVTITIQATIGAGTPVGTVVSNQGTIHYDHDNNGTNEEVALTDDPGVGGATDPTRFQVMPATPPGYYTLLPCRLVDTRNPTGPFGGPPLTAGVERIFPLVGQCGIPAAATAISVNLAVTQPSASGNVRLYPAGTPIPLVSFLNFSPGQTRGNNAIVSLSASGGLAVVVMPPGGTTDFILDVNGYFVPAP